MPQTKKKYVGISLNSLSSGRCMTRVGVRWGMRSELSYKSDTYALGYALPPLRTVS